MITKLKNIGTVITGNTPKTSEEKNYATPDIPFVKPSDLCNETITLIDDTEFHISEYARDKARIVPVNSVFMTCIGIIGKVGINNCECAFNQQINVVVPNTKKCLCEYLAYALVNKKDIIQATANAPVVPILNKTQFENIEIDIPNLEKQKEVVAVLTKIDYLISTRKQQVLKLDELIKSRFIELFGNINLNDKNWAIEPLGNLCEISRGGSPRPIEQYLGGTVPWIKIGDASDGDNIYLNSTKEHILETGVKKSRLVKRGSLIFANCGVSLGFARIITFDGCIHDGWLAFENIDSRLNKIFLLKSLNQMTEHFRAIAPAGTQPNLNTAIMKVYMQIIPPIELQKDYVSFVEQTDKLKFEAKQSLEKLEMLKKALMQEYFG